MKNELLYALVEKHRPFAQAAREHLHRNPELSDCEEQTAAFIKQSLDEAGISWQAVPGMHGIVGLIRGGRPGKTVALRADMDALPITEISDRPYCSQTPGVMHACGHDVHTAILLGTARVLQEAREHLSGCVKLFFQPAEEADGGAKRMVAAGCMKNPTVDWVYGLHVDAAIPCGTLRTKAGAFNASSDTYDITVHGRQAHGADPHLGCDAVLAASSIVVNLQSIVSRRVSPHDSAVVTVGKISGGTTRNTIAEEATLSVMVRTTHADARARANAALVSIVESTCAMYGAEAEIHAQHGYDAMYNDADCVEEIRSVADRVLGDHAFSLVEHPFMGCEDFCYFCTDVPGAFYQLGSRNESLGITASTHSPRYDADPDTIPTGMKLQAGIVFDLLGDGQVKPE